MKYLTYNFETFLGTMTTNEYIDTINLLEDFKPRRICEIGCGQSTQIFETYCNTHNAQLFSIEHDENYKRKDTIIFELADYETNIDINGNIYDSCNKYIGLEEWLAKQDKFDFILVDGPFGFGLRENYKYSRIQLLSFLLLDKISDNSYVLYHDSERRNAVVTLNEFERLLKEKGFSFYKKIIYDKPELTIYKIEKEKVL